MTRDLRNPKGLGEAYLAARKGGVPIEVAVRISATRYAANETCIEKYGRADEVKPKTMEVRVV